jgi:PPM family protein phosphatase
MDLFRRLFTQTNSKASEADVATSLPIEDKNKASTATSSTSDEGMGVGVETLPKPPESLQSVIDGATRPLPPETVITTSNAHLIFGQATDVGMVRTNNQDAAFSFVSTSRSVVQRPDCGVFIVADGMGGHHDGEKASALSSHMVASYLTTYVLLPILNNEHDPHRVPITEAMINAIQKANADVIQKVPDGGTTLTAVTVIGDLAYIAHVGDSRVYLIGNDGIEQITRDHSLVQRLIELDQLTREEANNHPQKNVLYRALGQSESLEVDALTRRLPPNSRLLICSDGLWNMLNETEIVEIIKTHTNPQEACDKLLALANTHGGSDNITAIVLHVPSH